MSKARWGVGAIEFSRQKEALPGEIMVDSKLGVFGVKSYEGSEDSSDKVISYEYISKLKKSLFDFKNTLSAVGRSGEIVKLDIGDYIGPFAVESDKSYSPESLVITSNKLKFFQFYFDVDVVSNKTGLINFDIDPIVKMTIGLAHKEETEEDKVITVTNSVTDLNTRVFEPDYIGFLSDDVETKFHIKSISFSLPSEYEAVNYKIILHSLFIAFQEV
jgi:hypothetical protein